MAMSKSDPSSYDWDVIREIRRIENDQRWLNEWGRFLYGDAVEEDLQKNSKYLEELYDELPSEFKALV